ncbi:MAG: GDP-mannose pyrophosphatase NudK [Bacteroidia bacterium]|nr:GDP-mannose pyrophosphatase NudK [Bacteroidia bacterium]NND10634.1 GDP-mannose pyrophosphatase NudK [Flavobacteriaceae bacterium]MBT8309837.1 GDP-mannose pyrophosphatase NudK [Bacteroidia bacterium]NNK26647.1 GDP-mannose pyrophosphatase NudK [Flavobacteriaceae bacterium]NNL61813.1 GDP-mannose pyrophosphatase NudK [Flavobacteriaceae bacterium]
MTNRRVKNIVKEELSDNWYTLNKYSFDFQLNNGSWVHQEREAYDRGNGAAILLYNKEQKTIILTKQFRMPTYVNGNEDGFMIEVCAGLLDNDNPENCIKKETEEETGYRVNEVKKVMEAYSSPGSVTEILHFFIAEYSEEMKVSDGGGVESETEDIEVMEVPFSKAMEMVTKGIIKDMKSIILLQYAQINRLIG